MTGLHSLCFLTASEEARWMASGTCRWTHSWRDRSPAPLGLISRRLRKKLGPLGDFGQTGLGTAVTVCTSKG